MYPVLIQLGAFRLHSYGLVLSAAMLVALWLAAREAKRKGLDPEFISNLGGAVILTGFLGARLAYVVGWEPGLLTRDPAGVLAVWRGGLALHGGLLLGFATGVWLCVRRRVSPWAVAGGGEIRQAAELQGDHAIFLRLGAAGPQDRRRRRGEGGDDQ